MPRMLVAYGMESTYVQATVDYLKSLKATIGYDTEFIHVTQAAKIGINFDNYDVLFQNYCARFAIAGCVGESYREALRKFRGLKVISLQDEYEATNRVKSALKEFDFNVVLTCVPEKFREYVYPKAEFPNTTFLTVLTGYVPEQSSGPSFNVKRLVERPIFLGYRARELSALYGRLGFEKAEIGRRMKAICDAKGISTDIEVGEGSRLNGSSWLEFVGNCRAMLGSESGSNVFDFDGSIAAAYRSITKTAGGRPPTYREFLPYLADREAHIEMGQISPRIFECAVMRTPMVLFRGDYSGCVEPDLHYIPLEKDFSNVDYVLDRLSDTRALEEMSARAYEHLGGSEKFGYREFGRFLRKEFDRHLLTMEKRSCLPSAASFENSYAVEFPTEWPQSWHTFKTRQLHRRGIKRPVDAMRLAQFYSRVLKKNLRAARLFIRIINSLESTADIERASGASAFELLELKAVAMERILVVAGNEQTDAYKRGMADYAWIGEYANEYGLFTVAFNETIRKWNARILLELRQPRLRKRPWELARLSFLFVRAQLSCSKIEQLKKLLAKVSRVIIP